MHAGVAVLTDSLPVCVCAVCCVEQKLHQLMLITFTCLSYFLFPEFPFDAFFPCLSLLLSVKSLSLSLYPTQPLDPLSPSFSYIDSHALQSNVSLPLFPLSSQSPVCMPPVPHCTVIHKANNVLTWTRGDTAPGCDYDDD